MNTTSNSLKLKKAVITDKLFGSYVKLVTEKIIPYQWEMLNDRITGTEPSGCVNNFKIAAHEIEGKRTGTVFLDTDLYKWMETVAYSLENNLGNEYENIIDDVIELISKAQEPDGYLNTYFSICAPNRKWKNLTEGHELYTAGHMIEAAVAYYTATGKDKFLMIARKNADLICRIFGNADGQIHGYPGHQEIELALIKLFRVTGEKKYLDCAVYFINERGGQPNYFIKEREGHSASEFFSEFDNYDPMYSQSHEQPVKQREAVGHAVRAVYMYSAMADIAIECDDEKLKEACVSIWNNITNRRMYITGSIGSSGFLERFTTDYDLPNATNYSESCASVGLMMFGNRMNMLTGDASYCDGVETALYNTLLSGIGMSGERYFYVNPLEVVPEFCTEHTSMQHVKPVRQQWFSVACCPTNIARTLASLGNYIFMIRGNDILINQFISSESTFYKDKTELNISILSDLMSTGNVKLHFSEAIPEGMRIGIRIPLYCKNFCVWVDGKKADSVIADGYMYVNDAGRENTININLDFKPELLSAHPSVREDVGKLCIKNGPFVYCLEQTDNGGHLAEIYVRADEELHCDKPVDGLFGDIPSIVYEGTRLMDNSTDVNKLYRKAVYSEKKVDLRAVPYGLWGNRTPGEMLVWQKLRL